MNHRMPALLIVAVALVSSLTLSAQVAYPGPGPQLDIHIEVNQVENSVLRGDLHAVDPGASASLYVMPMSAWPNASAAFPAAGFFPLGTPSDPLHMEIGLSGDIETPLFLAAAVVVNPNGTLDVSQIYAFDISQRDNDLTPTDLDRISFMKVGLDVNVELWGDAGEMYRLLDPAGIVRQTGANTTGPGDSVTFGVSASGNNFPDNPFWSVEISTDGGQTWSVLLGN